MERMQGRADYYVCTCGSLKRKESGHRLRQHIAKATGATHGGQNPPRKMLLLLLLRHPAPGLLLPLRRPRDLGLQVPSDTTHSCTNRDQVGSLQHHAPEPCNNLPMSAQSRRQHSLVCVLSRSRQMLTTLVRPPNCTDDCPLQCRTMLEYPLLDAKTTGRLDGTRASAIYGP